METHVDLHALVHAAGDAIIVADVEGLIGFTAAEAVGHSLDLIIPERFRERHWQGYHAVMRTGQTRYHADVLRVPALRKDGQRLSIAFTVALLHTSDGYLTGIAAIVRDDTERWQEEQALRRRLAELEGRSGAA